MPGNGTIGGGSLFLDFKAKGKGGKSKADWNWNDDDTGLPVDVTLTFPDGSKRTVTLAKKGDEIKIDW